MKEDFTKYLDLNFLTCMKIYTTYRMCVFEHLLLQYRYLY